MFGIGMTEMIVILVLALLILGPDRIPAFARTLAKVYREIRTTSAEFTEILKEETRDVRGAVDSARKDLSDPLKMLDEPLSGPATPTQAAQSAPQIDRSRTQTKQVQDWSTTIESSIFGDDDSQENS